MSFACKSLDLVHVSCHWQQAFGTFTCHIQTSFVEGCMKFERYVWNNMRMSKWWHQLHFWVNCYSTLGTVIFVFFSIVSCTINVLLMGLCHQLWRDLQVPKTDLESEGPGRVSHDSSGQQSWSWATETSEWRKSHQVLKLETAESVLEWTQWMTLESVVCSANDIITHA